MDTPTKFLFVMDPFESLNLETETSLILMQELIERGQRVFWLQQEDIALVHDQPIGRISPVTATDPLALMEARWSDLNSFDAVLVRKDPPFDTEYLQLTLILDHLAPGIAQFNDVKALRNFNEKMLPLRWPEFTPPTLITMNTDQLERFTVEHRHLLLKPLNDCSGRGISRLKWDERGEFREQIGAALVGANGKARYLVAQKYLQNWLYWIVIDTVSIPLYIDRGLHLTALLFAAYVIIAVAGYISWRNHFRNIGQTVAA